ncbi:hypothetical protein [Coxiella endosymbiont of Ornithodoros amblus]|uniref:hypothetical protein n=1 Tax=Coxiella endosymbiont of Ornithodoros amblus TaxID=1656166 RepID=UPI00244DC891|nr:hypothetical protein [Coxiella endosymbiont of Ornithodoros amblus]
MNIRSLALYFIIMLGFGVSATTFAQGINVNQGILTGFYVKNNTGEDYKLVLFGTYCMQLVKVNGQELKIVLPFPKNSEANYIEY